MENTYKYLHIDCSTPTNAASSTIGGFIRKYLKELKSTDPRFQGITPAQAEERARIVFPDDARRRKLLVTKLTSGYKYEFWSLGPDYSENAFMDSLQDSIDRYGLDNETQVTFKIRLLHIVERNGIVSHLDPSCYRFASNGGHQDITNLDYVHEIPENIEGIGPEEDGVEDT